MLKIHGIAFTLVAALLGVVSSTHSYAFAQTSTANAAVDIEGLFVKVASYDYGQDRAPLEALSDAIRKAQSSSSSARALEKRLDGLLKSKATIAGKDYVCRLLSLYGTDTSVQVLSNMLIVAETSDMARYALERINGNQVNPALRKSLNKTTGKFKAGIINTLGCRRDPESVKLLNNLVCDTDPLIASASIEALGKIGSLDSSRVLASALEKTSGQLKQLTSDAYLRCADQMAAKGDEAHAIAIYKILYTPAQQAPIQIAALRGIGAAGGVESTKIVIDAIRSTNSQVQAAAIGLLNHIPGEQITSLFVKEMPGLPPRAQVQILTALAERDDGSALPQVVKASKNETAEVRLAALDALGKLGNSSTVMLLAEFAASSTDPDQSIARNSLNRLKGDDIDIEIVSNIDKASAQTKVELIRAAGGRGITNASDTLLRTAKDQSGAVRRESYKSLRDIASTKQIPELIDLLKGCEGEDERAEAERTLSATIKRSDNSVISGIVSAYRNASGADFRCSLLQVMGIVGNNDTLPVLREALKESNAAIKRGAILALTEWPDNSPMADLLPIAREDSNQTHRILALRGYIKLVSISGSQPVVETAKLFIGVMAIANRPEEKILILSAIQGFPCKESLDLAEDATKDPAISREAKQAADIIRRVITRKQN